MAKRGTVLNSGAGKKHGNETKYIYFITQAYVIFILAIYPLYVGPEGYDNVVFRKAQVFWSVSILFLLSFLIFYLAYRLALQGADKPPAWWKTMSVADWAVLGFLVFITLSCLFSPHREEVFLGRKNRHDGWLTYFLLVMMYFPISRWYKPKKIDFILFASGSIILCVIGFLQLYGMDIFNLFPYYSPAYTDDAGNPLMTGFSIAFRSTIGNIDILATYLSITVIAFAALYVMTKSRLRFLYLSASMMNFAMVIIGASRAGKVGVLAASVLLIPYWISQRERFGRALAVFASWGFVYVAHNGFVCNWVIPNWPDGVPTGGRAWNASLNALPLIPIAAVSLAALAVGVALLYPKFKAWPRERTSAILGIGLILLIGVTGIAVIEIAGQHLPKSNMIYQSREILHGRMQDNFGTNRGFVWRQSLNAFLKAPLLGTGSDTFRYALSRLTQRESLDRYGVFFDKAHNDFLQILVCNGIFALISYLVFAGGLVISSVKKCFTDVFALMALGAVLGYLTQSFFGLDSVIATPLYWLMASILRGNRVQEDEPAV